MQLQSIIDYVLSDLDPSEQEDILQEYWASSFLKDNDLLKLYISRIGVNESKTVQWKARLHESLITCLAKQSEHFHMKEHWLNPEVLL